MSFLLARFGYESVVCRGKTWGVQAFAAIVSALHTQLCLLRFRLLSPTIGMIGLIEDRVNKWRLRQTLIIMVNAFVDWVLLNVYCGIVVCRSCRVVHTTEIAIMSQH